LGHLAPLLPIARVLIERGHDVRWYSGAKYRARIEATGARPVGYTRARDYDDANVDDAMGHRRAKLRGLAQLKYGTPSAPLSAPSSPTPLTAPALAPSPPNTTPTIRSPAPSTSSNPSLRRHPNAHSTLREDYEAPRRAARLSRCRITSDEQRVLRSSSLAVQQVRLTAPKRVRGFGTRTHCSSSGFICCTIQVIRLRKSADPPEHGQEIAKRRRIREQLVRCAAGAAKRGTWHERDKHLIRYRTNDYRAADCRNGRCEDKGIQPKD
jgi:hypothetical protein